MPPQSSCSTRRRAIVSGSVWVDTDGAIHYIDADGDERKLTSNSAPHTDAAAVSGSVWVETYVHSVYTSGAETSWHNDVAHADDATGLHTDSHGDTSSHTDSHGDVAHSDSHGDTAHTDSHGDSSPHTDTHDDHADHADVTHADVPESVGT